MAEEVSFEEIKNYMKKELKDYVNKMSKFIEEVPTEDEKAVLSLVKEKMESLIERAEKCDIHEILRLTRHVAYDICFNKDFFTKREYMNHADTIFFDFQKPLGVYLALNCFEPKKAKYKWLYLY